MSGDRHPHSDLIDRVGKDNVTSTFGLTPQGLWAWRTRGIPITKRHVFAKLAKKREVPTPDDFFAPFTLTGGGA